MKWILHILLLLASIQGTHSQELELKLHVDQTTVGINQPIKFILTSNVKGKIIDKWPKYFNQDGTPSSSSKFVQNPNDGTLMQEHVITYKGAFSKSGSYQIGPFEMRYNGKVVKSNTISVVVSQTRVTQQNNSDNGLEVQGFIKLNKSTIYEGESVTIEALLRANHHNGKITILQPLEIAGSPDFFELETKKNWEEVAKNEKMPWQNNIKKLLLYPILMDKITIKPFRATYTNALGTKEVISNVPSIRIKPLPSNSIKTFYGAVGNFQIHQHTSTTQLRQGDVIPIDITVSGSGNFHQLQAPILSLPPGILLYGEPTTRELFSHTDLGTTGKVIYKYHLQILNAGQQVIPGIEYTFFDLETESYITIADSNVIKLHVMTNEEYQLDFNKNKDIFRDGEIAPFSTIENSLPKEIIIMRSWYWIVLLFVPGIMFFILTYSIKDNKFMEERFARFKRRPNVIREKFNQLRNKNGQLSNKDFKTLIALMEHMIRKRLNYSALNNAPAIELINQLKNVEEEQDNVKKLNHILSIAYRSQYAFAEQKLSEGIVEDLHKIAKTWKQI